MKTLFLTVLILATTLSLKAQKLIALQSGDNATFYTNLDTALFYAKNGDDIYLPGGYIKANSTTLKIDKAVNIIGVGYNPYTNPATENTIIQSSTIKVEPLVNGGSITGIYAPNSMLQIQDTVSNFSVSRCLFHSMYIGSTTGNIQPSNISIIETVVVNYIQGNVDANGTGPQNVFISNSIIGNMINYSSSLSGNNTWVELTCKNSILMGWSYDWGYCILSQVKNSLFENCILIDNGNRYAANDKNTFRNCIFNSRYYDSDPSANSIFNGIFSQDPSSIFIDPQGFVFNMKNDYRLKDSSPGKNAGKDGTDIGIYGGRYPWKDGGLPANPHIETFNVGGNTDTNGTLNVSIKVAAQGH